MGQNIFGDLSIFRKLLCTSSASTIRWDVIMDHILWHWTLLQIRDGKVELMQEALCFNIDKNLVALNFIFINDNYDREARNCKQNFANCRHYYFIKSAFEQLRLDSKFIAEELKCEPEFTETAQPRPRKSNFNHQVADEPILLIIIFCYVLDAANERLDLLTKHVNNI